MHRPTGRRYEALWAKCRNRTTLVDMDNYQSSNCFGYNRGSLGMDQDLRAPLDHMEYNLINTYHHREEDVVLDHRCMCIKGKDSSACPGKFHLQLDRAVMLEHIGLDCNHIPPNRSYSKRIDSIDDWHHKERILD